MHREVKLLIEWGAIRRMPVLVDVGLETRPLPHEDAARSAIVTAPRGRISCAFMQRIGCHRCGLYRVHAALDKPVAHCHRARLRIRLDRARRSSGSWRRTRTGSIPRLPWQWCVGSGQRVRHTGRCDQPHLVLVLDRHRSVDQHLQRLLVRQRRGRVLRQALRLQHPDPLCIRLSARRRVFDVQQPCRKTPDLLVVSRSQVELLHL